MGVAKRSKPSAHMVEATTRIRALMGGTTAMRAAGEAYLPKFEAESHESYRERLALSWLFNGTRKTVKDMAGRVFAKPIEFADDPPEQIAEWSDNIDLAGRDLSTFAREVFEDGLQAGVSYIMVDAPARDDTVTVAQVQASNLRPYFVHLRAEDILGWKTVVIDNVTKLAQLRIMEAVAEADPGDEFNDLMIDQVRVLDRTETGTQTRLFRKVKNTTGNDEWAMVGEPTLSDMAEITVVPFYANRTGFFAGEPPLDDLADVNIAHWQSQSDQRNILHFARVPILFASGKQDDEKLTISAGTMTAAADPQADLKWVEHSGAAIGAGRQDLKDLEFQMETHGLQLLVTKGQQSATGEALDAAKETSTLAMTADQLQDALEQAFVYMLEYAGIDGDVSLSVNKEFGVNTMDAQELTALLTAVNTGNLSRETFLAELKRRGMIAGEVSIEDEIERIGDDGALTGPDLATE